MQLTLFKNEKCDVTKNPLFFGGCRNTQRFDKNRYNQLSKMALDMQRLFWVPEEIKLAKDKLDFELASEPEKHIFTTQLSKLVMLDSLQGRSPLMIFGQLTNNPEFEGALLEQEYFEGRIHSRSYSYMIEEMFPNNKDDIFDKIWDIPEMRKEIDTITRDFNELYNLTIDYLYKKQNNIKIDDDYKTNLKEKIFLALVSMNILEGIRFYVGFACIWAISEFHQKFYGSSRILQLIARDENQHLRFTQYLIKILKRDDEFKDIWNKITPKIYDMYFEATEEEIAWGDVLLSKGNILGINKEIISQYMKFLANIRLRAIGLKPIYPEAKENPLKWLKNWVDLSIVEKALQESEEVDYMQNPIEGEINKTKIQNLMKFLN